MLRFQTLPDLHLRMIASSSQLYFQQISLPFLDDFPGQPTSFNSCRVQNERGCAFVRWLSHEIDEPMNLSLCVCGCLTSDFLCHPATLACLFLAGTVELSVRWEPKRDAFQGSRA